MEKLRPLLTTYAYNITGSLEDTKDVVQDAYVQFMQMDHSTISDRKAYLVRMVINLAINRKNRQKKLQSQYPGQWLPEPVATEQADSAIHRQDVLSYSLLVLMEKLNARQRAVFILKEAFDYEHTEIADVLNITADYSRQLLKRAKKQLASPAPAHNRNSPAGFLQKYLEVIRQGDTQRLEQLLNDDIVVISDGGGKVSAGQHPVYGKQSVAAMLNGLYRKFYVKFRIEDGTVNHQPALFYYNGDRLVNCQVFSLEKDRLHRTFFMRNPDKLSSLQKKSRQTVTP